MTWLNVNSPNPTTQPRAVLTCSSCHTVLGSSDEHRAHFQSDWHRYNLRRKVSELPPVTETVFQNRLGALNEENSKIKPSGKRFCEQCSKSFSSENAYKNHLKSRKHQEDSSSATTNTFESSNTKKTGSNSNTYNSNTYNSNAFISEDATEEEISAAIQAKLAVTRRLAAEECIFCNTKFDTFELNMEHMTKVHGLYIPDLDYIGDLQGLVEYLSSKVAITNCCLYCPAKVQPFSSLEAVRRHMIDKGHLKILFDEEGMQELAEFYDYDALATTDDENDEFEDISDSEMVNNGDDVLLISPDETELILPSGKRLGHRAYRLYYKQNLRIEEAESRPTRRSEHQKALIGRISDQYLALGLGGTEGQKRHVLDQRSNAVNRNEWDQKVGTKANKLQEHFRHQLRQ